MRNRTGFGLSALGAVLVLAGCSSAPAVEALDTDTLIATCLDAAEPVAQEDGTTLEGTVSSVTTDREDGQTGVYVVFDARDSNNTADAAACTMVLSGESVSELKLGTPSSELGTPVEDAVDRWNDKFAEEWAAGEGPEPAPAPEPSYHQSTY